MAISPLVSEKTHSYQSDKFSETVEYAVLHCANVSGNNNKFYCIEIQKDPTTQHCRLFSHYGRLNITNVYEIREHNKLGEDLTEERCKKEFDKIIKKKQRGRLVKRKDETIRETYHLVDVVSPTVGSSNIRNASTVNIKGNAPLIDTSTHDIESSRLLNMFVTENIHNITSNTTITFTSRGFETPLGPVTEPHLDNATIILNLLRDRFNAANVSELDGNETIVRDINSEYFSLIPRQFGYSISTDDMILTPDKLADEYSLLDNLRTAVKAGLNADDTIEPKTKIDIALLPREEEWNRLNNKFESTKHRRHAVVNAYNLKNIFTMNIPKSSLDFKITSNKLGNIHELFHGTKTANMLSIALNGLIIPPTGAAHVTGRMFGNGVYAASCSTKALNYAVGYWGGNKNRTNKAYVLIVKLAMGKEYEAYSSNYSGAPSGYNSIWAKSGRALLNDEFIVYNLNQVIITHIFELEK
jgi:poly [ADP-ribose] polymerase